MVKLVESFDEFQSNIKTGEHTMPLNVEMITDEPGAGEKGKVELYFGTLFQSRDIAHVSHLAIDSFAKHEALKLYYEGIIPLIDSLVEEYQGTHENIVLNIPPSNNVDIIPYFEELSKFVEDNKSIFEEEGNLANIVDSISSLIKSTLYKLKKLGK